MNRDHFHVSFSGLLGARPKLVELNATSNSLPRGLEGKKLLFASDVHMSAMYPERAIKRLLDQIEAIAPDLILWGGDYAESAALQRQFFALAARLRPPLGMFAVLGNNDIERLSRGELRNVMLDAGVRLLVNECLRLPVKGGSLLILGLDEPKHGSPELSILDEPGRPDEYRILLSHSPLALSKMPDALTSPPQLILCGHTHGGQLSAFGFSLYNLGYERARAKKNFFVTGTHALGDSLLIVSNGIGTTQIPLRVGAPPQLHLLHLLNKTTCRMAPG